MSTSLPSHTFTQPSRMLTYKEIHGRKLTLHIFVPEVETSAPRPCILLIHSGGWVQNSPEKYYFLARPLSEMGFVVACLEYRLYDEKARPPVSVIDAVADTQDAQRYLHANAKELNIDPHRIVACGGSAGAHLAAGLALFDNLVPERPIIAPEALVLLNPVIDTSAEGFGQDKLKENWEAYSPLHRLRPGIPPTLIFHGTGDRTTPYAGAAAFARKATANGDTCVLITHEGGDHGYYREEPIFTETLEAIQSFLQEHRLLGQKGS